MGNRSGGSGAAWPVCGGGAMTLLDYQSRLAVALARREVKATPVHEGLADGLALCLPGARWVNVDIWDADGRPAATLIVGEREASVLEWVDYIPGALPGLVAEDMMRVIAPYRERGE